VSDPFKGCFVPWEKFPRGFHGRKYRHSLQALPSPFLKILRRIGGSSEEGRRIGGRKLPSKPFQASFLFCGTSYFVDKFAKGKLLVL
jgi:hypothetical protein